MRGFYLLQGPVELCWYRFGEGDILFGHLAVVHDGRLVVNEVFQPILKVEPDNPLLDYRIVVGDVDLVDVFETPAIARGQRYGAFRLWPEAPIFDGARGATDLVLLASRVREGGHKWEELARVPTYVVPSKLGEERYETMTDQMGNLSRSLLADLYGKSLKTHDLALAREGARLHSHEEELEAANRVLVKLHKILSAIDRSPASRIDAQWISRRYRYGDLLPASALQDLSRRAPPSTSAKIQLVRVRRRIEVFDTPEHRVIRAFLELLDNRLVAGRRAAWKQISEIEGDRPFRDRRFSEQPTLYELIDVPKIERLERASLRCDELRRVIASMVHLRFLTGVEPEFAAIQGGAFGRNESYSMALQVIRLYLLQYANWDEGDNRNQVTKLTSRLFEQWCYLKIVDAFREAGVELREWGTALREYVRERFVLDFDRGMEFAGLLVEGWRIKLRYEPWIFGRGAAIRAGDTLCRGEDDGHAPWSPDIVIEIQCELSAGWSTRYSIVLDCKYTNTIKEQHWIGTQKYLGIRSADEGRRQVVKQLWLVHPRIGGEIICQDPVVRFTDYGPNCPTDETLGFVLGVDPLEDATDGGVTTVFGKMARGLLGYIKERIIKE